MKHTLTLLLAITCIVRTQPERYIQVSSIEPGPVTIYIHGTLFPTITKVFNNHSSRRGLYRYTEGPASLKQYLARALQCGDPELFPATSFHKYYWCGSLGSYERLYAAKNLYKLLRRHEGYITIIAHSHGCNVALNLAKIAHKEFHIERLILLAAPVQEETKSLVHSPLFKNVYSFYSEGDIVQTMDPQISSTKNFSRPLFSERRYSTESEIKQIQLLFGKTHPGHHEFITPQFFRRIPELLTLADTASSHDLVACIPGVFKRAELVPRQEKL